MTASGRMPEGPATDARRTVAGIEMGGTKVVCALAGGPDDLRARTSIPTTEPGATLDAIGAWLREQQDAGERIDALGVAAFGPVCLDRDDAAYGHITSTPKPGWQDTDVVGALRGHLDVPIAWDTDVNGAAVGELRWGAGQDVDSLVYLTVGTGIGGGAVLDGRPVHGLLHPEMGHLMVNPHPADDYPGRCPYHGRCVEGMASGPAFADRFGARLETLDPDRQRQAAGLAGYYVGQLIAGIVLTLSPHRIVVGGGVPHLAGALEAMRGELVDRLGGYVRRPEILGGAGEYVVAPGLGDDAGVLGAVALGLDALAARRAG
ncbi:ROK family protein [Arsenicicoccus dermatophilus]|uniref:ROK family protein n=1 Tax=Arsenicicoccus dermatophilus TaxID=1076331 RepID=UPI001F4C9878|nr:ROK family protein [Arsenicicoccus dermatophilus]MCH8611792.1 ROK family protein [Arsenicicoccus dermatophilus]